MSRSHRVETSSSSRDRHETEANRTGRAKPRSGQIVIIDLRKKERGPESSPLSSLLLVLPWGYQMNFSPSWNFLGPEFPSTGLAAVTSGVAGDCPNVVGALKLPRALGKR